MVNILKKNKGNPIMENNERKETELISKNLSKNLAEIDYEKELDSLVKTGLSFAESVKSISYFKGIENVLENVKHDEVIEGEQKLYIFDDGSSLVEIIDEDQNIKIIVNRRKLKKTKLEINFEDELKNKNIQIKEPIEEIKNDLNPTVIDKKEENLIIEESKENQKSSFEMR